MRAVRVKPSRGSGNNGESEYEGGRKGKLMHTVSRHARLNTDTEQNGIDQQVLFSAWKS